MIVMHDKHYNRYGVRPFVTRQIDPTSFIVTYTNHRVRVTANLAICCVEAISLGQIGVTIERLCVKIIFADLNHQLQQIIIGNQR